MATHEMKLQSSPFDKIKSGEKTIEVRLYDEKRKTLKLHDVIEFKREPGIETIKVEVIGLHRFETFADLANHFSEGQYGGSASDLLKSIYTYYTREKEEKYGVLGIEIKLL